MGQTVINKYGQPAGFAGQVSDNAEADIVSRFNADTTNMGFGIAVKAASTTKLHGVLNLAASSDIVAGIVVWGAFHMPDNGAATIGDLATGGLLPDSGFGVMRRGRMYVLLDLTVTTITPDTDRGWARCTVGASGTATDTILGAWSNAADTNGGTNNIDATKQTNFVGEVFTSADGVSPIAEMECAFVNHP